MAAILRFLRSVRLAIILISVLTALSAVSTLIPQGREGAFYSGRYPEALSLVILGSGFDHFFSSPLFLGPALLLFVNLCACAVYRFVRELGKRGRKRFGPDLLHLGIALLCVGSVLSFAGRQTSYVELAVGESARLADGSDLSLDNFEFLKYADGRPRDWISTVSVTKGSETRLAAFAIRVNHPLKLGRFSIYQASHSTNRLLVLKDAIGPERLLSAGDRLQVEGKSFFLLQTDDGKGQASFLEQGAARASPLRLAIGDALGSMKLAGFKDVEVSGLQAVADPGFPIVLAALVLAAAGIALSLAQKIGDQTA